MTRMDNQLCQEGVVTRIEGRRVIVKIYQAAACDKCHAKAVCSGFGGREKLIETKGSPDIALGDRVKIEMEARMGWIALLYTFVFPFFLMAAALFSTILYTGKEVFAALLSVGILAPYYFLVFLFRDKISRNFIFRSVKI